MPKQGLSAAEEKAQIIQRRQRQALMDKQLEHAEKAEKTARLKARRLGAKTDAERDDG